MAPRPADFNSSCSGIAVTSNNTSLDALLKEIEDYFDNSDEAGNDEGGDNEDNSGGRGQR